MNQTVSIGGRLREERMRLGLSQPAFGEVGGVTKKTQMLYESGERFPDAQYLSAVAAAGADVLYILTGQRSQAVSGQAALPPRKAALLDNYDNTSEEGKKIIEATALAAAKSAAAAPAVKKGKAA